MTLQGYSEATAQKSIAYSPFLDTLPDADDFDPLHCDHSNYPGLPQRLKASFVPEARN
jgi:hypothetical protein